MGALEAYILYHIGHHCGVAAQKSNDIGIKFGAAAPDEPPEQELAAAKRTLIRA
jgi:hypothetical protein